MRAFRALQVGRRNGRRPALEKQRSPGGSYDVGLRMPEFVRLQDSGLDSRDDRQGDDDAGLAAGEEEVGSPYGRRTRFAGHAQLWSSADGPLRPFRRSGVAGIAASAA
jgi:hypothetical protein